MNKETRKKYYVEQIKREKKEIRKDVALLAAEALVVGVATLGVFLHGENYITEMFSNSGYWDVELQGSAMGISLSVGALAIYFAVQNVQNIKESFESIKDYNERLRKTAEEDEKERTR